MPLLYRLWKSCEGEGMQWMLCVQQHRSWKTHRAPMQGLAPPWQLKVSVWLSWEMSGRDSWLHFDGWRHVKGVARVTILCWIDICLYVAASVFVWLQCKVYKYVCCVLQAEWSAMLVWWTDTPCGMGQWGQCQAWGILCCWLARSWMPSLSLSPVASSPRGMCTLPLRWVGDFLWWLCVAFKLYVLPISHALHVLG